MLQEPKKTHVEMKHPQFSLGRLADYMAASEQARRTIAQSCKYRSIARVVQHIDAKMIISNALRDPAKNADDLKKMADQVRNKMADDQFEADVNEHNADYIERFAEVFSEIALPKAEIFPTEKFGPIHLNGVRVSFNPQLLLRRNTKTNKVKSGAIMLRYAKGKSLSKTVAGYQSAGIFGYMRTLDDEKMEEAERELCITLDAYAGRLYEAPTNATYLFKEIKAACATISERWPAIKPPKNAVL